MGSNLHVAYLKSMVVAVFFVFAIVATSEVMSGVFVYLSVSLN